MEAQQKSRSILTSGVKKKIVSLYSPFFCRASTTRPIAASSAVTIPEVKPSHEKTSNMFLKRTDTNPAVQSQNIVRGWKFWI